MLETPFGNINISFDDKPIDFQIQKASPNKRLYPDITDVYLLTVLYGCDGRQHSLKCYIENCNIIGSPNSGELLEAISFYVDNGKIEIGCECEFNASEYRKQDFDGNYLNDGLEIMIMPSTHSQKFVFGVSWLNECTKQNEVQTWFASDPRMHNN